jgi:hypothetical protein
VSAQFYDQNGELRLDGTLVGGGGSQPVITREQLGGNAVTVADGTNGLLTLDTGFGPDALLDLSDPSGPLFIAAGVYAVTIGVRPSNAVSPGGSFEFEFLLDVNGESPVIGQSGTPAQPSSAGQISASMTYYCPAGAELRIIAYNNDGGQSLDFSAYGNVQRLS